jgi:hypothetical protein
VAAALAADLLTAGPRYSVAVEPRALFVKAGEWIPFEERPMVSSIVLQADGQDRMWSSVLMEETFTGWLVHFLEQVADEVMEHETEMWPPCPWHRHLLWPRAVNDWVAWVCDEDDEVVAVFGELGRR